MADTPLTPSPELAALSREKALLQRRQAQRVVDARTDRALTAQGQVRLGNPDATTGVLPPSGGGTGGTGGAGGPPAPFVYLTDDDGAYLLDDDGAYLIEYTDEPEVVPSTITIEEVDGSPTVEATKLVLPNGTLGVVGTVATYTPDASALVDHALWKRRAALLEPLALEGMQRGTFNHTIADNTKYLLANFANKVGTGTGDLLGMRDAREPLALPVGTNLRGTGANSGAVILNPERAVPHITNGYSRYHDLLLALDDLPLKRVFVTDADTFQSPQHIALFLPGPYGCIVRHISQHDCAWGGPAANNGAGYATLPETDDDVAAQTRYGHPFTWPATIGTVSCVVMGYPNGDGNEVVSVLYSDLPADWSAIPDAPEWREDCLVASLDTATKWRRTATNAAHAQIDATWPYIRMNGSGTARQNTLTSVETFDRGDEPSLTFDIVPGDYGAGIPSVVVGFSEDVAPASSKYRYTFAFATAGATKDIYVIEQDAGGSNVVAENVGSYENGFAYRCRITLDPTAGAIYELQGGDDHPPIGSATWDDVTPGGTQGTLTPVAVMLDQEVASLPTWVGNLRVDI
jgi:hypothetical protein